MIGASKRSYLLSNNTYDSLKKVVQIGLPAVGTLYFALSQIWGLPHGEQVVGTVSALSVFLGCLLGFSSRSYNSSEDRYDGKLEIEKTCDQAPSRVRLDLNEHPSTLEEKEEVIFKVDSHDIPEQGVAN